MFHLQKRSVARLGWVSTPSLCYKRWGKSAVGSCSFGAVTHFRSTVLLGLELSLHRTCPLTPTRQLATTAAVAPPAEAATNPPRLLCRRSPQVIVTSPSLSCSARTLPRNLAIAVRKTNETHCWSSYAGTLGVEEAAGSKGGAFPLTLKRLDGEETLFVSCRTTRDACSDEMYAVVSRLQ